MQIICDQCSKKFYTPASFCPYCGEEAPRRTVLFEEKEELILTPKYCPDCGKQNIIEAIYCSDCGSKIHQKPEKEIFQCGKCGEKNKSTAVVCCSCGLSFTEWFSMQGEIAELLGYKGDLILTEKMTGITYNFLSGDSFSIGRKADNSLIIPCNWVSGHHCRIDFIKKTLYDFSSNGTFINRKPEHIKAEPLEFISEFNVAGSFTFPVLKRDKLLGFHLGAIIDEPECRRNGDGNTFDEIRKNYYLLFNGDFNLCIQKLDGFIPEQKKPGVSFYEIKNIEGYYYYSDFDRNINNMLILKEGYNLPKNWQMQKT